MADSLELIDDHAVIAICGPILGVDDRERGRRVARSAGNRGRISHSCGLEGLGGKSRRPVAIMERAVASEVAVTRP